MLCLPVWRLSLTYLDIGPEKAGDRGMLAALSADMSSEERPRPQVVDCGLLASALGTGASEKRLMARCSCMPACLPAK